MAIEMDYVTSLGGGKYKVRMTVKPDLIPVIGKANLTAVIEEHDEREAKARLRQIVGNFEGELADARRELAASKMVWTHIEPPRRIVLNNLSSEAAARIREVLLREFPDLLGAQTQISRGGLGDHSTSNYRLQRADSPPPDRYRVKPREPVMFNSIIETWIKKQSPRESSVTPYRSIMRQLAMWLHHSDAARITQDKLREYEKQLYEGRKNTTVKNHITVIKGLFDFAYREGLIHSDPAAVLTTPKTKSDKRSFTLDERKTLLIESRKMEPLIHWATWISAFSGARLAEITTANKSDIEIEGDYVVLNVPSDRAKNGKHRRVPLHSSVLREGFRDYLDTVPNGRPLFPDRVGWNHSSLVNEWMRVEPILITDRNVTFHSHRHTFYSFANELADGQNERIPERFAEAIAGHSSGRASRRYGHIPIATLASYVERIPDPTAPKEPIAEAA